MPESSSITAVLGPTNTGKTHRAIERMLDHDSGMIGLPLRLLAREVYDRVTTRVGEARVALVTGEEKRVPRRPDYWVCTVEAMPMDREVDFLAIDEVQLAAHPQRGHVFTDRLLHARGRRETWFLGAGSMRGVVGDLVPTARFVEHPRLSRLAFAGADKLTRIPARTAVVAFSTPHVYEVAEKLRSLYGGVAVVLGALSPRTRNAQVAMFQAGEVDLLVATDAIGMGLNLDVDHVAFAALRKFDGREARELDAAELAQIAGRAGRNRNDGTFGTVAPVQMPVGVAEDIEAHRFHAVRKLVWRNSDLDFSSVEALMASLRAPSRTRVLKMVDDADDSAALAALARVGAVRERARGEEAVRLLWDVCSIPDYRKILLEVHAGLLAEIYAQVAGPRGALDPDWLAARVGEVDEARGDLETLMARIAAVRTWTYVTNHARWLPAGGGGAAEWQERTREVEDRLSDALHQRLVEKFVDKGGRGSTKRAPRARGRVAGGGPAGQGSKDAAGSAAPPAHGHPFAALAAMRDALTPASEKVGAPRPDAWVEALLEAPHEAFGVDARGRIAHDGRFVGELVRGSRLVLPDVKLVDVGDLGAGAHARIQRRLVAYARDLVGGMFTGVRAMARGGGVTPAAQRVAYVLEQGLGTVRVREVAEAVRALTAGDRAALAEAGVVVGARVVYLPALLEPTAVERRVAVCSAFYGRAVAKACPTAGAASVAPASDVEGEAYDAIGYPVFGTRALRADVAERVASALAKGEQERPSVATLASWMGCPAGDVAWIADELARERG